MPDPHLSRLRAKYQAEADKAERRLAQSKKALEGIEAAMALEEELEREADGAEETEEEAAAPENGDVMELIQSEALTYEGVIRAPSFARYLEEKYPDRTFVKSTVSHALRQGAERGNLVLVERGQGKRPSIYRSIVYEQPQEEAVEQPQEKAAAQIDRRSLLLKARALRDAKAMPVVRRKVEE